ncbi:MAG: SDR family oxidoreductase [Acetobacterales bacterium]
MTETVLITGASRGSGLDIVRQYAAGGATVIAACRNPDGAAGLKEIRGSVEPVRMDVGSDREVADAAAKLKDRTIDVLINNAGIYGPRDTSFSHVDYDAWTEVLKINGMAPLRVTQHFADHVARSKNGRVATVSSLMGSVGDNTSGGGYIYRSSKAMVNQVMRSVSFDLRDRGVVVVVLHPGWVQTDMGGPNAAISPEDSASGLRAVIDGLRAGDSGRFFNYDGRELPW